MVINDTDDFVCAFAEGEQIVANWKGATFLATEKLGHGYQSRKVYHAVRGFWVPLHLNTNLRNIAMNG